ncbi:MAG: transglycosylase SLT domain-containing protein [Betaproteobacteria bacterium]|nr:transglycosylase SLT domain-containing protein [Betaproteobacteria bacterium]
MRCAAPECDRGSVVARRLFRRVFGAAMLAVAAAAPVGALAQADSPGPALIAATQQPSLAESLARAQSYEHGEGLPQDQRLAAAMYCEAAVAGSPEAAFRLGWMYANGRGVAHDDGTAVALFQLAASEGDAFSKTVLQRLPGTPGMLPDCMRPVAPPESQVAEAPDAGPDPFADLPPWKRKIADLVAQLAPSYGIEPRLALAVIAVESNFDAFARSVKDAQGLMQLLPETAQRFKVRNAFDMRDNVRGGLAYLRWLLAYYRGEVPLAAAAYNAGEKAVDRYGGVPPYRETRDYVRRVVKLFRSDYHPYDPKLVAPSVVAEQVDGASK